MRIGQTSMVRFGSEMLASLAGFIATLYIANELGGGALGTYALFVAVLIWFQTGVDAGLGQTIRKRVSEAGGGNRQFTAAVITQVVAFVVVASLILFFRHRLNRYLGFDGATILVVALGVALSVSIVRSGLHGEHKVHVAALLVPLNRLVRSSVHLGVVFLGLLGGSVVGLVWGYVAGALCAAVVGALLITLRFRVPTRSDFEGIFEFSRYAWLSGIEERTFSAMDTVVLGFFVTPNLIGYYEVAWNLASLLAIFSTSVAESMFPEISELDSENRRDQVSDLINDALAFSGLFLVPGLAGVLVIGEGVLAIYGPEFQQAATVLVVLIVARLLYAYEANFVMAINGLDRPETAFRVNLVFVVSNIVLNVALVHQFGWLGAAIGTAASAGFALVLSYVALSRIIDFQIPVGELGRQAVSALVMGPVVIVAEGPLESTISGPLLTSAVLVTIGTVGYFAALFTVSPRFRTTVSANLPV